MDKPDNFIVTGFPRSGTTLLYCMLMACVRDGIFYDNEKHYEPQSDKIVFTKSPWDCFSYWHLSKVHEHLIWLFMIRDPRDILISRHSRVSNNYFMGYDKDFAGRQGLIGFYEQYRYLSGQENVTVIKYEDLITNANLIQAYLQTNLGIKYNDHKFTDFHNHINIAIQFQNNLNGLRKLDSSNQGKWIQDISRVVEQIDRCPYLLGIIIEMGYESNNIWYEKKGNIIQSQSARQEFLREMGT